MGYRTTVILSNDLAHEWSKDSNLGAMIAHRMNHVNDQDPFGRDAALKNYGRVVECAHADTQTLAVIDSLNMRGVAFSHWAPAQTEEAVALKLLRDAADRLGYRLTKKPA